MKNIINYIMENNRDFELCPFNEVDSLVLSQFSYIDFLDMVPDCTRPGEAVPLRDVIKAEYFDEMLREVTMAKLTRNMMYAIAASPRFRNIPLSYYVDERSDETQMQFSAVCFDLGIVGHYLAFRGTDATFLGWKEDFNMAFTSPVPSQTAAAAYMEKISKYLKRKILLGGHSKGGNLAIYAAAKSSEDVQERIHRIYSHDGPGFTPDFLASSGYENIKNKISKSLPQSAMIGMMLENEGDYRVVKSNRMGLMQHDPFSWEVEGEDFVHADKISDAAQYMNNTISDWIKALSAQEREMLVDFLYSVVNAGASSNFSEFSVNKKKEIAAMFKVIKHIDKQTRAVIKNAFREFLTAAVKNTSKPKKTNKPGEGSLNAV